MRNYRIQGQITEGRLTLPIVTFACIACWIITSMLLPDSLKEPDSYPLWQSFREMGIPRPVLQSISFVLYAIIGYFLIEINNTFSIIRIRASVQTSLYLVMITACPGLHLLYAGDIAAVALLIAIYFLFQSYQQPSPSSYLFHSFAFIGAGSLIFPQLTFFVPIWLVGAYNLQALTPRSLCAAAMGWSLPYWFLLGYAFFYGQMNLFYNPFRELVTFYPLPFGEELKSWQLVTLGYMFILYIVSAVHCSISAYKDKIRTRAYLLFLISLAFFIFLFIFLQPQHCVDLLSPLLIVVSILAGHLFVLTNTRASNWFFIGSSIGLILLYLFNLWALL